MTAVRCGVSRPTPRRTSPAVNRSPQPARSGQLHAASGRRAQYRPYRAEPSQSTRPVRSHTTDESERAVRLDSAESRLSRVRQTVRDTSCLRGWGVSSIVRGRRRRCQGPAAADEERPNRPLRELLLNEVIEAGRIALLGRRSRTLTCPHRLSRPATRASCGRGAARSLEWHEPARGLPARRAVRRSAETPHPSCEQKRGAHLSLPVADVSRVRTTRQDRPSPKVISCATASASSCAIFCPRFCALIPALFVASTARWRLPASVGASLASTPSRTI